MTTYSSDSTEWCPQHGYPLPCPKCGMGEYEHGLQDGRKEVVEWINQTFYLAYAGGVVIQKLKATNAYQAKLKEWGL